MSLLCLCRQAEAFQREARAVQRAGRSPVREPMQAPADEVIARAEDELGAGLSLLPHLNPHLGFPLFLLGREEEN